MQVHTCYSILCMTTGKKDSKNTIIMLKALAGFIQNNDPQLQFMFKKEINKLIKAEEHNILEKEVSRRLKIQNKKLLEQIERLRDSLKQTKLNRNQLLSRYAHYKKLNKDLAGALGSCNVCWGEDENCQVCGGDGIAGWRTINKRLFNQYVLPSVEKLYGWKK